MTAQDLFITPIYIILFSLIAYFIRPYVTTSQNRTYFLPALWVKFFGAIMLGVIYQFYYGGGDTFNYFTHGSRWIWEAFLDDPYKGIALLFESGGPIRSPNTFFYSQNIWYYRDPHSYIVVKIAAFFSLFTFHTYSATAIIFAAFSFSGMWAFFKVLCERYGYASRWLAIGLFFIPSTFFWGSGILKDTITLGALGWLAFSVFSIVEFGRYQLSQILIGILMSILIFSIKIYILICFLPMVGVWIFMKSVKIIQSPALKFLAAPILMILFVFGGLLVTQQISSSSDKYQLSEIANRAAINAYDNRYGWGARSKGDGGYDLGTLDGSWSSMIRLIPSGIAVSIFRPFLWEVRNPLMLLAALEALFFVWILGKFLFTRGAIQFWRKDAFLIFSLLFALLFAFAVGVSTYNFGSLMRYKIPLVPFYFIALAIPLEFKKLQRRKAKQQSFEVEKHIAYV